MGIMPAAVNTEKLASATPKEWTDVKGALDVIGTFSNRLVAFRTDMCYFRGQEEGKRGAWHQPDSDVFYGWVRLFDECPSCPELITVEFPQDCWTNKQITTDILKTQARNRNNADGGGSAATLQMRDVTPAEIEALAKAVRSGHAYVEQNFSPLRQALGLH